MAPEIKQLLDEIVEFGPLAVHVNDEMGDEWFQCHWCGCDVNEPHMFSCLWPRIESMQQLFDVEE